MITLVVEKIGILKAFHIKTQESIPIACLLPTRHRTEGSLFGAGLPERPTTPGHRPLRRNLGPDKVSLEGTWDSQPDRK